MKTMYRNGSIIYVIIDFNGSLIFTYNIYFAILEGKWCKKFFHSLLLNSRLTVSNSLVSEYNFGVLYTHAVL
jgi:hypothetical protein